MATFSYLGVAKNFGDRRIRHRNYYAEQGLLELRHWIGYCNLWLLSCLFGWKVPSM
ncbi:hypothetical protein MGG_16169 [Pyricularia oryzae 70-15]|uniref:Uncharacterized protein n=1 Tax=Pyricularia oryzae (strain 70-15 / ATCC MYA-4617 / FGSC 8958) TaxID=242507 RepID=G4MM22_PYRO7|nr:uncharacterized protein MGG_16169 [Pyricularia oryzae 70-15]EHA56907.1 hypothetical protein MGG_16169 [Pyricularia oryzae 70-15]